MPTDTRYLVKRHQTWHCQQEVPRPLRDILGKKRLVVSLQTHEITIARSRRFEALAQFKRIIDEARRKLGPEGVVEQGLEWKARLAKLAQGDQETINSFWGHSEEMHDRYGHPLSPKEVAEVHADLAVSDYVDHLRETVGDHAAGLFVDVAMGKATPLLYNLNAWLGEGGQNGPYSERSQGQFRSDLQELAAWAEAVGLPLTVEAFTRQAVGRYVQERLAAPGANRATINRKISAASGYWRWMEKRGHAAGNPWVRQSVPKVRSAAPGGKERPFAPNEIARLLNGGADQELDDAMRVAALTGARLDAIYRLTVGACRDGWFVMPPQKKEPGPRRVPIHSALHEIVERRSEGKKPTDFLFHEPGPLRAGRERSMAASKRFGHYRQRPGVDVYERPDGVRRSLVNFHSWRRTFTTLAEQAGQAPHIISAVIGHKEGRAGMTLGRYSGGPSDDQLRACVEAVRLPA